MGIMVFIDDRVLVSLSKHEPKDLEHHGWPLILKDLNSSREWGSQREICHVQEQQGSLQLCGEPHDTRPPKAGAGHNLGRRASTDNGQQPPQQP